MDNRRPSGDSTDPTAPADSAASDAKAIVDALKGSTESAASGAAAAPSGGPGSGPSGSGPSGKAPSGPGFKYDPSPVSSLPGGAFYAVVDQNIAGILAKKAVEKGLTVPPWVKTSLAPGLRVAAVVDGAYEAKGAPIPVYAGKAPGPASTCTCGRPSGSP